LNAELYIFQQISIIVAKTYQVGVRLTPEDLAIIDRWIEKGDFDNRAEFVRFAVKKVLKLYDGGRVGFDLPDEPFYKKSPKV